MPNFKEKGMDDDRKSRHWIGLKWFTLREMCPNAKLFYSVNLRIQSEYRKKWTRNNSILDTFHAVSSVE